MKRILISAVLSLCAAMTFAIPAKKSWKVVSQSDGTTIKVSQAGDEHLHYYITEDNVPIYKAADNRYCYLTIESGKLHNSGVLAHESAARSAKELQVMNTIHDLAPIARQMAAKKRSAAKRCVRPDRLPSKDDISVFKGSKKALVILAAFSDKSFSKGDDAIVKFYDEVLNQEGYSQNGAAGSVHDYFKDMSRGEFDLTFDIVGPVKVSKSATYYGGPSPIMGGADHIGEFITEAIKKADEKCDIDWKKYDWDDDGEVEQVFVLYAGYGQATGGPTGTIWPNAWTLDEALQNSDGNGGFSIDGVFINQYACSNELYLDSGTVPMGLGVFCHEFSHCMGLPDMYDTNYGSTPTMGDWDLLAGGSYNGPQGIGWCPAGWTSYERAYAGWLELTELKAGDIIKGMTSLEEADGKAYVIYNDNHKDEYYLLENHKGMGWDKYTPENGLLIIHVDYDKDLFDNNIVNSKGEFTPAEGYDRYFTNDHPRMAPFSRVRSIQNDTYFYTYPMDAPRGVVDSLTDTSKPAAELYNALADGSKLMGKPVYNIEKDDDGNISFTFMTKEKETDAIQDIAMAEDTTGDDTVYDITGKKAGRIGDIKNGSLKAGIYIIGGKRLQKKVLLK
ncbi:MAG: M6 family metalloprotease domain-containing protein [Prevotella pectinovora]|uniref:M6 family metalloprotease domain-containing protein n=1 Tax=Prevotella sp. CAG:592 TaxID=1262931 RepID=UPI000335EA4A|nr:M6 family metalloprotease domain-containing protein [Prevotella sp. CAG:592]CDD05675.1 m6 family metalloprotease domain protein [Prevotella sp. CAG:592]